MLTHEILFVNLCPMIVASNDQSTTQGFHSIMITCLKFPKDTTTCQNYLQGHTSSKPAFLVSIVNFPGSRPLMRSWYICLPCATQKDLFTSHLFHVCYNNSRLLSSRDWRWNILAVIVGVDTSDILTFLIATCRFFYGNFSVTPLPSTAQRPLPPGGAAVQNARLPWGFVNRIYMKLLWYYMDLDVYIV